MRNFVAWFVVLSLLVFVSGCGHVISKNLRAEADPTLSLPQVLKDPTAFKGKNVVWGGEIIQTTNLKDGNTLIEVFQRRLGWRGEPKETSPSEGRFLIQAGNYLDPYVYRSGRKITVAGEIIGESIKPIGEMNYRYPLILGKQIYLWPVRYYAPYPAYYYDPWWYPSPWYPWGYPFGWGFGVGFRFRHH